MRREAEIALIGAAGQTGQALVRALLHRDVAVRAVLHGDRGAKALPDLDDFAVAELDDEDSLRAAIGGARIVHYIPPTYNEAEERFGANVIAAAVGVGAERLVYHSVLHAPTPAMPHHLRKSRVELALRESPLAWTIVQPAMYMQTVYAFLSPDRTAPMPGFDVRAPFTPVDVEDLGEAVANILTSDDHAFATYELSGTAKMSFEDMGAAIGRAAGTAVAVRRHRRRSSPRRSPSAASPGRRSRSSA